MFVPLPTLEATTVLQEHAGADARSGEVVLTNGSIELAGTLVVPPGAGPHPAILFLQGSGEHSREPALPTARHFAELGLVALACDKRGTGSSSGDWRDASLDDLARDAIAELAWLRARPEVDPHRVGLFAPSQGAWVATAACARVGALDFLIAVSGGGVTPAEAERWAYGSRLRAEGSPPAEQEEAAAFVDRYLAFLATGADAAGFEGALDAALTTNWWTTLDLDRCLPFVERRATWSWVGTYDPRADLAHVRCPVLVLLGENDELQPSARAAQRWRTDLARSGNDDVTVRVFAGANHYLRATDAASESDPHTAAFLPEVQAELAGWLGTRVVSGRAAPPAFAFTDVNVVLPDEGRVLERRTVLVRGDRIARVGAAGEVELPVGTRRIEGGGRYLVPGLFDAHVHVGEPDLPLFLANGVTTIRELNGTSAHLLLRERLAAGELLGPRLVVASPMLAGERQRWRHVLIADPVAAELTAERFVLEGYDALKVYDGLTAEAYAAIEAVARRRGSTLVGHVPAAVGLEGVLACGQELQHTEQIVRATVGHALELERIPAIVGSIAGARVVVTPTLASQAILCSRGTPEFEARYERPELAYVDAGTRAWWDDLRGGGGHTEAGGSDPYYAFQRELVRALAAAGVPLLAGTDTPNPLLVPGFSLHEELLALAEAGLSPTEALRAATSVPARVLGFAGELGRIAEGLRADLVLVDENPLEALATLRRPRGVMSAGRWLDEGGLRECLAAFEAPGRKK